MIHTRAKTSIVTKTKCIEIPDTRKGDRYIWGVVWVESNITNAICLLNAFFPSVINCLSLFIHLHT